MRHYTVYKATMKKEKSNTNDHAFKEGFKYSHDNPYHDRLSTFDEFVLRDDEGEAYAGSWNKEVFQREAPIEVEIGTGYGHFMMEHCSTHQDINFVGMDHRFKRSFHLAKKLNSLSEGEKHFRYLRARGERLEFLFGPEEISKIYYFFPDPWPKNRHHKKRLFQTNFLNAAYKVLKKGGKVLVKTDHDGYFEWMQGFLEKEERFEKMMYTTDLKKEYPDHFLASFETKFEKIFLKQGIKIKAMVLVKK
jgi:tRNA (guanine-N7-)-methyltransferase